MSDKQKLVSKARQATEDVLEIMRFEHWVRFYYVKERDEKLFIEVPDEKVEDIRSRRQEFAELVDMVNNEEIDQQKSQENLCSFIASRLDGRKYKEGMVEQVMNSNTFKLESYLFGLWNQTHEALLDDEPVDFDEWERMYKEWRKSEEVANYVSKLVMTKGAPSSTATQ
ncbi:hypothetical protein [Desulfohalovibrio reitneri]|uniref:hypothetical protein n=1 Tax=Desulfohalovibrio reitneri TaxID=1307759 RepID=UPI0004A6C04E|nr:hypothetical protein [Desulfohalovibrio reitneri]